MAFILRFDFNLSLIHLTTYATTLPILCFSCFLVFTVFRLSSTIWSFFSFSDLPRVFLASIVTVMVFTFLVFILRRYDFDNMPRSVIIFEALLLAIWVSVGRFMIRYLSEKRQIFLNGSNLLKNRILIFGNIQDCDLIIRSNKIINLGRIVAIVTPNRVENNMILNGSRIIHIDPEDTGSVAKRNGINTILLLPPYNKPFQINTILESCRLHKAHCHLRHLPSLSDLASGKLNISSIKDVGLEELLGRNERKFDHSLIKFSLNNKKVMVTGAGGSIGSELCRQIASYSPKLILLYESSEIALYSIENEIRQSHPDLKVIAFAGDVKHEEEVISAISSVGGIDIIYHAAAYKHVPLMEENVPACIRNNVLGSYRLAKIAQEYNVKKFIMISTDKAVRPTSIMGASKRLAEKVILQRSGSCSTEFVAVRFGNVLGSSGSVLPKFKEQIRNGGPVTVTSPNMRRFFMTIPEAVELVLQAGSIGNSGEVMVLEMGEPVIIADMARNLIELSGLIPDEDIKIEFTGLRNGEKEYEEIITEDENVVRTPYDKIFVMKRNSDQKENIDIKLLEKLVLANDEPALRKLLADYIPENMFQKNA